MEKEKGLEPFIDNNSEILIVGTFPSGISICSEQYYANTSHNSFWKLIYKIYEDKDIVPNNYPKRKEVLKKNKIALCDVYSWAARLGNSDSKIDKKNIEYHKLDELLDNHPNIKKIIFNGQEAAKVFKKEFPNITTLAYIAESTSGNRMIYFEEKLANWQDLLSL